ncbi:MAG: hypothetical protein V1723_04775, partial [Candidatus Uhrbacteria bacterium]
TSTTDGVDALQLTFGVSAASGNIIDITPSYTDATAGSTPETYNIIDIDAFTATQNAATDVGIINAVSVGNLTQTETSGTITATALNIGTGWETILGGTTAGTNLIGFTNFTVTSAGAGTFGTDLTVSGGDITGANSDSLDIGEVADAQFTFTRNDNGTVTLTAADNDADAGLTIVAGGTATLSIGDSGDTLAFTGVDMNFAIIDGSTLNIDGDGSPSADLVQIGSEDTTASVIDGLDITLITAEGASGTNLLNLNPTFASTTNSSTHYAMNIANITATSTTNNLIARGINIGNMTEAGTGTVASTALNIGTGWDTGISVAAGGITITAGALAVNSDSITSDGALVINATSTDIQDVLTVDSIVVDIGGITVPVDEGLDTALAGALELGKATATSIDLCNSAACDTIDIGNLATDDADTINIGAALDNVIITDANWTISGVGVASFTDLTVAITDGATINLDGDGSPTADLVQIGSGDVSATAGVDALQITFDSLNASGNALDITFSGIDGNGTDTTVGVDLDAFTYTSSAGTNIVQGISIGALTEAGGGTTTSTAIYVGSGWDSILNLNAVTLSATELGLLDNRDTALVDTTDAVSTAITGVGTLGSLTVGPGTVNINTSGTSVTTIGITGGGGKGAIVVTPGASGSVAITTGALTRTERLCSSANNGGDAAALSGATIGDCSTSGQADLAEHYGSDGTLEAGDFVSLDTQRPALITSTSVGESSKAYAQRTERAYDRNLIGVVSTNPFNEIFGEGVFDTSENPRPIALVGRVPVKVTAKNGAILPGDRITSSDIPGVGMKATEEGSTVGIALEPYDSEEIGKIIVFVNLGWNHLDRGATAAASEGAIVADANGRVALAGDLDLGGNSITNVRSILASSGKWRIDDDGTIVAEVIEVKQRVILYDQATGEKYCVSMKNGILLQEKCDAPAPAPAPASAPAEGASAEPAPVESAPAEEIQSESAPVETPTEPAAESATPSETSAEPAQVESAPAEVTSSESVPAEVAPTESAPASVEAVPSESAPAPVEAAPAPAETPVAAEAAASAASE